MTFVANVVRVKVSSRQMMFCGESRTFTGEVVSEFRAPFSLVHTKLVRCSWSPGWVG